MIVVVDGAAGAVRLDEAEVLTALSARLDDCTAAGAPAVLGDLGDLDGEHVWLNVAGLRDLSPLASDADWVKGYDGTIAYARSKGWTSGDGAAEKVRAHLE